MPPTALRKGRGMAEPLLSTTGITAFRARRRQFCIRADSVTIAMAD